MFVVTSTAPQKTFQLQILVEIILYPIRQWLDSIELPNAKVAKMVCQLIPSQCPFERDVQLFGRTLFHIPPMCKINPVYDQLMGLRFRALSFLADVCGEDITPYCC